jgi:hypothetical protein
MINLRQLKLILSEYERNSLKINHMEPPSLSNELGLSLSELSFGVQSSQILSIGPVASTVGAPPMAKIDMSDGTEFVIQVTERGWQVRYH